MCRWLAYAGPPLPLAELVSRPDHSLLDQSLRARESVATTNGDGFGVGWYGPDGSPAVYRDTHPAWNDDNLRSLAAAVDSGMFLAHVRTATGTAVQRTNCHPFRHGDWLFVHNGSVPGFVRLKRDLVLDVDADLYPHIEGSTDSETLFFLALTYGLEEDPPGALARAIGRAEAARESAGIDDPIHFSACAADGQQLWAVRYSSHGPSRTLYHSNHIHALRALDDVYEPLPPGATIVVSEPLDELSEHWVEVGEATIVHAAGGEVSERPFRPYR